MRKNLATAVAPRFEKWANAFYFYHYTSSLPPPSPSTLSYCDCDMNLRISRGFHNKSFFLPLTCVQKPSMHSSYFYYYCLKPVLTERPVRIYIYDDVCSSGFSLSCSSFFFFFYDYYFLPVGVVVISSRMQIFILFFTLNSSPAARSDENSLRPARFVL